jgi:hypothetical protein
MGVSVRAIAPVAYLPLILGVLRKVVLPLSRDCFAALAMTVCRAPRVIARCVSAEAISQVTWSKYSFPLT